MNIIETLVNRGIKLHIVEIGASVPLAFNLMKLPGASKVVHCSESPYGNAAKKYDIKCRMVSEEAVRQIAIKTAEQYDEDNPEVNTIVVTSFQIQSNNDVIPHGWVYIMNHTGDNWVGSAYHFTYWNNGNHEYDDFDNCENSIGQFPRTWSINLIGKDLIRLLMDELDEFDHSEQKYLDISTASDVLTQKYINTLVCFVDGKPVRFEDYSRNFDNLILYKGSFNPVHIGHIKIAEDAKNRCPNSMVVFAISRNTYQKGRISNEELMKRIKNINDHGYMVVIFDSGFFYDNYLAVSKRFSGKTHIALGADSFNRLIKCYENDEYSSLEEDHLWYILENNKKDKIKKEKECFEHNFGNAHFIVYGRRQEILTGNIEASYEYVDFDVDISSTKIRELIESGNSEEANKLTGKGE